MGKIEFNYGRDTMKKFLITTLVGGALFLIPLVFFTWILGKAFQIMLLVAEPLSKLIPVDSVAGIGLISALALLLMILICLMTGLLARARLAKSFYKKSDGVISSVVPSYTWTKIILKNLSGHQDPEEFKPVLVKLDDQTLIAFETERCVDNNMVVLFFPGAPDVQSGTVGYVEAERVTPLKADLLTINRVLKQMGKGAAELLTRK